MQKKVHMLEAIIHGMKKGAPKLINYKVKEIIQKQEEKPIVFYEKLDRD
jgi:hypothetical protein